MRFGAEYGDVIALRGQPLQFFDRTHGGHAIADDDQARLAPSVTLRHGLRPHPNQPVADFRHIGRDRESRLLEAPSRDEAEMLLVNRRSDHDFSADITDD